ncbi:hypothetical protein V2J09_011741 [Rumex salicifolius]
MKLIASLVIHLITVVSVATTSTGYDHYLLNCGAEATSSQLGFDDQTWFSDNNSTFSHSFSSTTAATTPTTTASQVPFGTARVFTANFTYSFPVSPGPKFIRLFFNPSSGVTDKDAYLTVHSNSGHLLLRNFSAYLFQYTPSQQNLGFVEKEFYLHVASSLLQLTFSPTRLAAGSYAFVNGIEVISVPENLYVGGTTSPVDLVNQPIQFSLKSTNALEKAYRLNVGGSEVAANTDSGRMYRRWSEDDPYLIGGFEGLPGLTEKENISYETVANYSAPTVVFRTFRVMGYITDACKRPVNLTWEFEVDLGFLYLVRLHWCEVDVNINSSNYRVFSVYIGGLLAEEQMDVFARAGSFSAIYRDYVVYIGIGDAGTSTRGNLQLAMHPDSLIVGHGGFGNVYKGTVHTDVGPTLVAIKRLKALSSQGAREFAMEIRLLSWLRHVNLVSLIGYCNDAGEMILVYEYMPHGTLRDHLQHNNTHLSWQERLKVCIGAACGLNYLHTGTDRMVIHRDVKSANILLDEAWVAKVADFGLSKLGPRVEDHSHVSTAVKGSFGYLDPEYYRRQHLTEKSDVYSFGVVLLEVMCGRVAVNPNLPKEQINLRIWARKNQLSGTLDSIVDPKLTGQIAPGSLRKFWEVAERCVRDEGAQRPLMADVIGSLELALKIQTESVTSQAVGKDYPILDIAYPATDANASVELMGNSASGDSSVEMKISGCLFLFLLASFHHSTNTKSNADATHEFNIPLDNNLSFQNDRQKHAYVALQAWKKVIQEDPKSVTSNWVGADVCSYTGVFCAPSPDDPATNVVAGIDLNHANIAGFLPDELGANA